MTDQHYFEQYVKSCELIFEPLSENSIYIKDAEFKFQFINRSMLELIGINSLQEVKGHTNDILAQLDLADPKFIDKMNRQDKKVSQNKKVNVYLELIPFQGRFKLVVLKKSPIINPETGNFLGMSCRISDLVWPHVLKTLFKFHEAKGLLVNHKNNTDPLVDYPLNNVQHMVLYLCINNYSYSEIALLMSEFCHEITPIRVNDYLEQLKLIFHVRTKTQLIEKAVGLNFHVLLPCDLFNNLNSIDIQGEIAQIVCCNCRLNNCSIPSHLEMSSEEI